MVGDAVLFNSQHYKARIKGKVEQSNELTCTHPNSWRGSYWKGTLRDTLDQGHQLYFIYIYIYIFSSWKMFCNPRFHEGFCKTTIIRQLRRWWFSDNQHSYNLYIYIYIYIYMSVGKISLCTPSHQTTPHVSFVVEKQQIWITVYICVWG